MSSRRVSPVDEAVNVRGGPTHLTLVGFGGIAGVLVVNRALHPLIPFGMAAAFLLPPIAAVTLIASLSARELRETILIAGVVAWIILVVFPVSLFLSVVIVTGSARVSMPS
jgi:hypothetical protein